MPITKNCIKKNKKNRFGGKKGNTPFDPKTAGYARWDIRNAQRHLAAQEIDWSNPKAIQEIIGERKLTIAETIAIKQLMKAMTGADRAVENVTNNICGKLPETIITPPPAEEKPRFNKEEYKKKFPTTKDLWNALDAEIFGKT